MSLVSVIVPVYNVERFLDTCITSLVRQTYENLEIILVDDGSTDSCSTICDDWAKKDDRIVVIHKKNGGLSDARNAGLERATGEWIMFVDSDDFVCLDMVRVALGVAEKNQSDLVAFGYLQVCEDCNGVQLYSTQIRETLYEKQELLRQFVKDGDGSMVAWNKLYRKEIWNELRYPVGKIHEDEFVIVDILQNISRATVIDTILYYYRQRKGSIIDKKNRKSDYDVLEAFDLRCKKLLDDKELYQSALNLYLQQIIEIYPREQTEQRRILHKQFRKKWKISLRYTDWKVNVCFLLFAINPDMYFRILKMFRKRKHIF